MAYKPQQWRSVAMSWNRGAHKPPKDSTWKCNGYRLRFSSGDCHWECDYFMGVGCKGQPKIAEALESLQGDCHAGFGAFADFCDEFGYCQDSRSALDTYLQCQENAAGLRRLLGKDWGVFLNHDFNSDEGGSE